MFPIAPGISTWRRFSGEKNYYFNGFVVDVPEGEIVVDPPAMSQAAVETIWNLRNPIGVLLTNWTHRRNVVDLLAVREMPVFVHEADAPKVEVVEPDVLVDEETTLSSEVRIVTCPGKSLGEVALYLPRHGGTLIVGDTVIGSPAGSIGLLPDEKLDDRDQLLKSLEKLAELDFVRLLVGDGEHILQDGKAVLQSLAQNPRTIP